MIQKTRDDLRSAFFGTWERSFDQGRLALPKRMRLAGLPRFWRVVVEKGRVSLKPAVIKLSGQRKGAPLVGPGRGIYEIDRRGRLFIHKSIMASAKLGDKVLVMASRKGDYVIISRVN